MGKGCPLEVYLALVMARSLRRSHRQYRLLFAQSRGHSGSPIRQSASTGKDRSECVRLPPTLPYHPSNPTGCTDCSSLFSTPPAPPLSLPDAAATSTTAPRCPPVGGPRPAVSPCLCSPTGTTRRVGGGGGGNWADAVQVTATSGGRGWGGVSTAAPPPACPHRQAHAPVYPAQTAARGGGEEGGPPRGVTRRSRQTTARRVRLCRAIPRRRAPFPSPSWLAISAPHHRPPPPSLPPPRPLPQPPPSPPAPLTAVGCARVAHGAIPWLRR